MRALRIFEKLDFKRGQDPKRAMKIGHKGILKALLDNPPPEVDSFEFDATRDWMNGLSNEIKELIEYSDKDPLAVRDYYGFDEDSYIESIEDESIDHDSLDRDFKSLGIIAKGKNEAKFSLGKLPDGTKVAKYWDGMGSGYIAHKNWIKR
jgi:hypothetical protein